MGQFFGKKLNIIISILLTVISLPCFAITFDEAQGSWTRVGDGCSELNTSELEKLPRNGGGNSSRRRMVLTITQAGFSAASFPSLRCDNDFQRNDFTSFDNEKVTLACTPPATNSGSITFAGDDVFTSAVDCRRLSDNPWGCSLTDWKVRRVGDVLEFKYKNHIECKAGENYFYIYFIPSPLS